MSLDLLHCRHSDQTRTPLVHSLQFHLRLEAVGCTLKRKEQCMMGRKKTCIKLVWSDKKKKNQTFALQAANGPQLCLIYQLQHQLFFIFSTSDFCPGALIYWFVCRLKKLMIMISAAAIIIFVPHCRCCSTRGQGVKISYNIVTEMKNSTFIPCSHHFKGVSCHRLGASLLQVVRPGEKGLIWIIWCNRNEIHQSVNTNINIPPLHAHQSTNL